MQRYEREAPGDLLHIDIKKLAGFEQGGHRITGNRRLNSRGSGWDYLFVETDDHFRAAFIQIHPDERRESATRILRAATDYFATLGVSIERLLTDNGSAFCSHNFRLACAQLGITHKFTRTYRPQTNDKGAESSWQTGTTSTTGTALTRASASKS
jgi:transposase InsO family protein